MAKEGEEFWKGQVGQKAVIKKDGKILIQRSPLYTNWDLPGGRMNTGESPQEGLVREVKEEIGVTIIPDSILGTYVHDLGEDGGSHLFIAYTAVLEDPSQEFVLEEAEVAETRWITEEEFNTLPIWEGVRPALELFFKMSDK
jgi:8-oxo-dGTP diphosphatase